MTSFELICAVLSAVACREKRDQNNLTPFPVGATRTSYTLDPSSGFEASAFEYDGKIIISYAGTRISEDDGFIAAAKDSFPDGYTDLMLGFFGHGEEQLRKAAEFYARVEQAYPGRENDIVFTGHSLGGGLAAVMGVYFNKPAITFDPAPFRLAATRGNALIIADYLQGKGFADDANFRRSYYTPTETTLMLPSIAASKTRSCTRSPRRARETRSTAAPMLPSIASTGRSRDGSNRIGFATAWYGPPLHPC